MPKRRRLKNRRLAPTPAVFVVKVQLSLETTAEKRQVLVYDNEGRIAPYQADADEALLTIMAGRPKAFFFATLDNGTLSIGDEAPWEDW